MADKSSVTYETMSTDIERFNKTFDEVVQEVKTDWLGAEVPMFINDQLVKAGETFSQFCPADSRLLLCKAQKGTAEHARTAITSARAAFPAWRETPWQERAAIIRRVADALDENSLDLAALMTFEVGKGRMGALGEIQRSGELMRYYANALEKNQGYVNEMGKMDPNNPREHNYSVLRPYGVWVVISPFNFPVSLTMGPVSAALLTGNVVVFKGSSDTPYIVWKLAELFSKAGFPKGVFNFVSGPGSVVGQELLDNPGIDGWTFTGSYDVGMGLYRHASQGIYPRPVIIEMGGKNPAIITNSADPVLAAAGVLPAAFGLGAQRCSACSRVYAQEGIYDTFKEKLIEMTRAIKIGDPTRRDTYLGPLINQKAVDKYKHFIDVARRDGNLILGGKVLTEGDFAHGNFVEPAIVEGLPEDHELVKNELFVPILHLAKVKTIDEAMQKANDTIYGLTAGFYGTDEQEIKQFVDNSQAGTIYVNHAAGATIGIWPGIQAFSGWKGSGASGKGIGGLYSLPLYMHEQSHTIFD